MEKNKAIANEVEEKEPLQSIVCITLDQVRSGLQRNSLLAQNNKANLELFAHPLLPPSSSSYLAEDINAQVNRDNEEIDQLIRSHGEQLKRKLAERDEKQYKCLALAAEGSALKKLREKEVSLDRAVRRIGVLQMEVASLSRDSAMWKSTATRQHHELRSLNMHIASLTTQLNKAKAALARLSRAEGSGESDTAQSSCVNPAERAVGHGGLAVPCHGCYDKPASVVILPCRHLCLCKACNEEAMPLPCPVCYTVRSGFMHVFFGPYDR